ncbi:MAG: VCBS repeat-containing protein [Candidatus Eisenbacteria bacterium]|uniref:VCBS repeat-containing protein n=1 Tax=Eiseniibacteriota bacterium TaxID=2212470 RepID=A0A937XCC7_UNCEI|nr:VCBS repeat-containing protein [Candidatus Eisenbacteria bacterium]
MKRIPLLLLMGGAAFGLAAPPRAAGAPQAASIPRELPGRISIVVDAGRAVSPEEVRAPARLLDSQGRIVIVDQVQGFIVGRFGLPPGLIPGEASGGVALEGALVEGPPIPDVPLTTLSPLPGFPFVTQDPCAGGPGLADFDDDGVLEILVATTGGALFCLTPRGDILPGWPQRVDSAFYAAPSAGDVDGDGTPDIVIGDLAGRVHAWDASGRPLPGFPVTLHYEGFPTGSIFGAAALEDLNGDGSREICVGTSTGLVCVLDGRGRVWPGWPKVLPPNTDPPNPAGICASPALADLDGDRLPEIVVATNAGTVHAWSGAGRALPGWPVELPFGARAGYGGVAVGDATGDGAPEIVLATERGLEGPATIVVLDARGSLLPGWPFPLGETCNAAVALGDLTGDGAAEIVAATIGGDAILYALDGRGAQPLPGWPLRMRERTVNASPLLVDLDGNGSVDILVASLSTGVETRAWLSAFDAAGDPLHGFPVFIPGDEIVRATPAVTDIDGDGGLELLAATELRRGLHLWSLGALCDPELLPWAMLAGGPARTGALMAERLRRAPPSRGPIDFTRSAGRDAALSIMAFDLPRTTLVGLAIFDIKSRPVRTLLDQRLPAGRYEIHWDGRDDGGRDRASGIYFYQLSLDGRATTRQLLLLK